MVSVGDELDVKVVEIDQMGRINLSHKILLPRPEGGSVDERPRTPRHYDDNNHRGGGGFRNRH